MKAVHIFCCNLSDYRIPSKHQLILLLFDDTTTFYYTLYGMTFLIHFVHLPILGAYRIICIRCFGITINSPNWSRFQNGSKLRKHEKNKNRMSVLIFVWQHWILLIKPCNSSLRSTRTCEAEQKEVCISLDPMS